MANIWRPPKSLYWTACYSLPDTSHVKKSTKLAVSLESAARRGLTEAHARTLVADLYSRLNEEQLPWQSAESFFKQRLARKERGIFVKYESVVKQFLAFLGKKRRRKDIAAITIRDVAAFRGDLAGRLSIDTGKTRRNRSVRDDDQKRRRDQLGAGSKHARSPPGPVLSVAPNPSS